MCVGGTRGRGWAGRQAGGAVLDPTSGCTAGFRPGHTLAHTTHTTHTTHNTHTHTHTKHSASLAQDGVISQLIRTWLVDRSSCTTSDAASTEGATGLLPQNVWPVFALLGGGILIAALWAGAEVLYYHFAFSKVKNLRKEAARKLSRWGVGSLKGKNGRRRAPSFI